MTLCEMLQGLSPSRSSIWPTCFGKLQPKCPVPPHVLLDARFRKPHRHSHSTPAPEAPEAAETAGASAGRKDGEREDCASVGAGGGDRGSANVAAFVVKMLGGRMSGGKASGTGICWLPLKTAAMAGSGGGARYPSSKPKLSRRSLRSKSCTMSASARARDPRSTWRSGRGCLQPKLPVPPQTLLPGRLLNPHLPHCLRTSQSVSHWKHSSRLVSSAQFCEGLQVDA